NQGRARTATASVNTSEMRRAKARRGSGRSTWRAAMGMGCLQTFCRSWLGWPAWAPYSPNVTNGGGGNLESQMRFSWGGIVGWHMLDQQSRDDPLPLRGRGISSRAKRHAVWVA